MSHVTHLKESCKIMGVIDTCDMTHSYVWQDVFICVTWRNHLCDMTHSYVRHDSFIYVTWLIHMCDMTHSYVWQDVFTRDMTCSWVTCLVHRMGVIYTCTIAHSYLWLDLFTRVGITPSERERDMTHSCVCRDSFVYVLWLVHMGHSYVSRDSFTPVPYLEIICGHN